MKVLVIIGSPRRNGNTSAIIEKIKSVTKKGINFETLHLSDFELKGCLGCSCCQQISDMIGCVQDDITLSLLRKLISADVLIYATPLYGHSYSGQLKLFMDRHVAFMKFISGSDKAVSEMEIHSLIKDKPCVIIVSCQGPEENNTELIKTQFDKFCESSLTKCCGKFIFPWCNSNSTSSSYSKQTIKEIKEIIETLSFN